MSSKMKARNQEEKIQAMYEELERMYAMAENGTISEADKTKWFYTGTIAGCMILKVRPEMLPPVPPATGPSHFYEKIEQGYTKQPQQKITLTFDEDF